jgi:signal transduction histidine kinase
MLDVSKNSIQLQNLQAVGEQTDNAHGNGTSRFAVSDTGIGIPDKKQETLFEPFSRVGSSLGGPGRGLAVAVVFGLRLTCLY